MMIKYGMLYNTLIIKYMAICNNLRVVYFLKNYSQLFFKNSGFLVNKSSPCLMQSILQILTQMKNRS
jgi:hypothetical protein